MNTKLGHKARALFGVLQTVCLVDLLFFEWPEAVSRIWMSSVAKPDASCICHLRQVVMLEAWLLEASGARLETLHVKGRPPLGRRSRVRGSHIAGA